MAESAKLKHFRNVFKNCYIHYKLNKSNDFSISNCSLAFKLKEIVVNCLVQERILLHSLSHLT